MEQREACELLRATGFGVDTDTTLTFSSGALRTALNLAAPVTSVAGTTSSSAAIVQDKYRLQSISLSGVTKSFGTKRVLRGIDGVDTTTEVLGRRLAHPFIVAPTAFHGLATPEAEVATARGAHDADALYILSTLAHTGPRDLAAGAPDAHRWFQLYVLRDRGLTRSIVDEAVDCGFSAIVVTVDLPPAGRRERELRTGFTLGGDLAVPSIAASLQPATENGLSIAGCLGWVSDGRGMRHF